MISEYDIISVLYLKGWSQGPTEMAGSVWQDLGTFIKRKKNQIGDLNLVNNPPQAVGMSADNVRGWEIVRKTEHLAEKRSFEGKCEILRTISQPRTLSADIQASQKGVYLFYNPPINFHFAINRS